MTAHTVRDDPGSSWRDDAACLEYPAEWFTGPHQPGDTRRAIDVCDTCLVKRPCLEAALRIEVSADLGIWGGTTPATRRRIRRERAESRSAIDANRGTLAAPAQLDRPPMRTGTLELFKDANGDHIDRTGRVIVFEIHGEPPYMLMIDGQPRARTSTVSDAAGLAARFLAADARSMTDDRGPVRHAAAHLPSASVTEPFPAAPSADAAERFIDAVRGRR